MNIDILRRKAKRGENRRMLGNGRGCVLGHKERVKKGVDGKALGLGICHVVG